MNPSLSPRKATNLILVHCSGSPPVSTVDVKTLDRQHRQRGLVSIGFHYVITAAGTVQEGRCASAIGAHAVGYNDRSIGICMVGGADKDGAPSDNFKPAQWFALRGLLRELHGGYPRARTLGTVGITAITKACPQFDLKAGLKDIT